MLLASNIQLVLFMSVKYILIKKESLCTSRLFSYGGFDNLSGSHRSLNRVKSTQFNDARYYSRTENCLIQVGKMNCLLIPNNEALFSKRDMNDSERLTTRHNGMSWRVLWINVCCFTSTVTCQTGSSCMNFLSTKNYWEYVRRRRPRAFKGSYIDGLNLSSILWVFALERRNLSKWFRCG